MPQRYGHVSIPVYRKCPTEGFVHEGSCVLVRTATRFWLLSAAHVFNPPVESNTFWLMTERESILLKGDIVWRGTPLDLAYTEIPHADAHRLVEGGSSFLPIGNVNARIAELGGLRMIVRGFPEKSVHMEIDQPVIQATPYNLNSRFLSNEALKIRSLDPAVEFAGTYKNLVGSDRAPIGKLNMRGLSGAGAWCEDKSGNLTLVGIIKEFHPGKRLLIGTRIRPMIEEMKRRCSENFPS